MKICLFEWSGMGHHPGLLRSFAEALVPGSDVVLAMPEGAVERVGGDFEVYPLPDALPRPGRWGFYRDGRRFVYKGAVARRGISHAERAARELRPDHLVFMYVDPLLRWLSGWRRFPVRHSICAFGARAHYPEVYGTDRGRIEQLRAELVERSIARWRRRPDAHTVFTLDRELAGIWSKLPGAPARWLPEAPLEATPPPTPPAERVGCIFFGHLEWRKGLHLLAAALEGAGGSPRVTVAGEPAAEYSAELERVLAKMRANGNDVRAILERLPGEEAMREVGAALCAVLPYEFHPGTSRVLTEAAAMGTPVIGPRHGLVGHLIEKHGLGLTVDPHDAAALRAAIEEMTSGPEVVERFAPNLRRYADEFLGPDGNALRDAVRAGLGIEASAASDGAQR